MQSFLLVRVQDVLVFQHVRIFPDILTSLECVTLLNMFEVEEGLMLPAHVVCPKVDRRAVGSCGVHDIDHDLGDVNFLSPWE